MTEAAIARQPARAAPSRPAIARWIALLLPAALLGGALGSQYWGGLVPCEMCYWQRWPHAAAILLAALAFTAPAESPRARMLTLAAAAAIAISGLIGVYHAGVELGIFEGLTTCSSMTAAGSPQDALNSILKAPLIRCDQVQFSFLGVSMAGWNALLSLAGAAAIVFLIKGRR